MEDRELLELAAKAAGLTSSKFTDGWRYSLKGPGGEGLYRSADRDMIERWNPLDNDGDALRLAVKLGIDVQQFTESRMVEAWKHPHQACGEDYGSDPDAATRRAIVRAAAAIGRQPP